MRPQRLLAFAALAFAAACTGDMESPTAVREEAPVAQANIPNPLFQLNFSPTSAFFQTPNANEIPTKPQRIVIFSPYAAFATLGPPRVAKVEYTGGPGGWLTGNIELKSAFQADFNLRVVKGMPLGAYQARITITLLGVVNYVVNVTFVSGVYFLDYVNSDAGWTFTGLWHVAAGNNCNNFRGCTPAPYEGTGFLWYASEATGNFNFGNNSGNAISPPFALPAGAINPTVSVRTFFEIEYDVSPFSFDFMEFHLDEDGNPGNTIFLGRINGSPGFNGGNSFTAPGGPWLTFSVSVPASAFGKTWRLRLHFETRDGLYNDYRGWGVDEILIIESGLTGPSLGAGKARVDASLLEAGRTFKLAPPVEIPLVRRR